MAFLVSSPLGGQFLSAFQVDWPISNSASCGGLSFSILLNCKAMSSVQNQRESPAPAPGAHISQMPLQSSDLGFPLSFGEMVPFLPILAVLVHLKKLYFTHLF